MSARLVEQEVAEFLRSAEPQILCIFGRWGVGKTFAWNHYLKNAQIRREVTYDRYSYVSLFGRASLADARDAIVEGTVDARVQGLIPNLESFETLVSSAFKLVKLAKPLLPFIPKTTGYGEGANRLLYLAVYKQIICLDDLERAGENLRIIDILGLASELKEQKRCKVVLLLNQEELDDRETFQRQLEKVADVALAFSPSPEEAAEIGIDDGTPLGIPLRAACIELGLVNIRVIKKALRLAGKISALLHGYDERILVSATRAAVLGCFSKHQPGLAPSLDFIRDYNQMVSLFNGSNNAPEVEQNYGELLRAYGFHSSDDLDGAIFDAVETGALDEKRVKVIADEQQKLLQANDAGEAYRHAWRPYHDTFRNNEAEVLDALENTVRGAFQTTSPGALSAVVKLMRELGHDARADALVAAYMNNRVAPPGFWNLAEHHMRDPIDPVVRAGFEARYVQHRPQVSLEEAVGHLADQQGWQGGRLEVMAAATPDDYYALFTGPLAETTSRSRLIEAVLQFGEIGNASPLMLQAALSASEALRRIGGENTLNALRIRRYRLVPKPADEGVPPNSGES